MTDKKQTTDDWVSDDIADLTTKQGEELIWRLYRTRGHNLVEMAARNRRLANTMHLSPTKAEHLQASSALQWAMQAERAEVVGLLKQLKLEINADKHKAEGEPTALWDAQLSVLNRLQEEIAKRGPTLWPAIWTMSQDEKDVTLNDTITNLRVAIAKEEEPPGAEELK